MSSTAKHILQKGAACQRCKERKVRCDALKPACTACRRSARFRGDNPDDVVCCFQGRRCGTAPGKSATAQRVKSLKPATAQPATAQPEERAAPPEAVAPSSPSPWANQIYTSLHESSTSLPPPPFPALAIASSTLPSPSTSSLYPVSIPVYATPLPAPVALPPPNQELPIFLDYCAAPLPSPMSDLLGDAPVSYSLSSPASSFSLPSSEDYMSGSSLTSSPFSLCDDLDYALASANVDLPDLALPATPAWYPSTDPFSTAFGTTTHGQGTFLPTGQNGDETIALPLFSL